MLAFAKRVKIKAGVIILPERHQSRKCRAVEQNQVGQLSQTNRAAAWVSFGKNVSEKSMHRTSLYYTAQNIFRNAETFSRAHQ